MSIRARWRYTAILGFALTVPVAIASSGLYAPAIAQPIEDSADASASVAGQIDSTSFEEAISNYRTGDAGSVASLVATVAPQNAILKEPSISMSLEDEWLAIEERALDASKSFSPDIGVSFTGTDGPSKLVDGVIVNSDVDTDLDLVHRETAFGEQFVTVLGSEASPKDLEYELDLPEGANLKQGHDGTIEITAPVETEVSLPGEDDRVESAASEILGHEITSLDALDNLTDEQVEQLAAVPDAETKTIVETRRVGTIEAPWAVDANGQPVETHYVIDGSTLVQTVKTDADTAFPVVADPSFRWWVEKGLKCGAGVASLAVIGYGKIALGIGKLVVKMSKAKSASNLGKAYSAWKKLGTSNSSRFNGLVLQLKNLAFLVVKKGGPAAFAKHRRSSTKAAASITFIQEGGKVAVAVFGLGSCLDMINAK